MNNLNDDEAHQFYLSIKDALCDAPYACSMILQQLAVRTRQTYSKERGFDVGGGDILADETVDERLISLQLCNNNVTDDILYEFIQFAGSETIVAQLRLRQEWSGDLSQLNYLPFNEDQFRNLRRMYAKEMKMIIERIEKHPASARLPESNQIYRN